MIRYLRSDDPRNFGAAGLPAFPFYGRSVFNLRFQVGNRANPGDVFNTIMCVKAGLCGRLTPLVTDLPRSLDPMYIVVLRTGSPGDYSASFTAVYAALVTCCALTVSACECLKFSGSKFSSVCSSEFVMQKDQ